MGHEGTAGHRGHLAVAHDLASRVDAVGGADAAAKGTQVLHARARLPEEGMGEARGCLTRAHDLASVVDAAGNAKALPGDAQGAQVDDGVGPRRGLGDGHRAGPGGQEQEEGNDDREAASDPFVHDSLLARFRCWVRCVMGGPTAIAPALRVDVERRGP